MNELTKRGIKILMQTKDRLIIETTKTMDTIFYMQTLWWHIAKMEADDIWHDGKLVERNLLYYYR